MCMCVCVHILADSRGPSSDPQLRLIKKDLDGGSLNIECSGKSERLKSFVRWCYVGPPLARPDTVEVSWAETSP